MHFYFVVTASFVKIAHQATSGFSLSLNSNSTVINIVDLCLY